MKKILFSSIAILCLFLSAQAQNDTIYYNAYWEVSTRDNASFYRLPPTPKLNGFLIKDYYITGELQMEALSLSKEEDTFDGLAKWYYKSGALQQTTNYIAGKAHGEASFFDESGNVISKANYVYGVVSGEIAEISEYGYYRIATYANGTLIRREIIPVEESKAKIVVEFNDCCPIEISYYNVDGELIGTGNYSESHQNEIISGVEVTYFFNPMRVMSISKFEDGKLQSPKNYYYTTGELKMEEYFTEGDEQILSKTAYFNKKGVLIDSLIYQQDNYGSSLPYSGKQYDFGSYYSPSDQVQEIYTFEDGKLHGWHTSFYPNGKKKNEIYYENEILNGVASYFDESGKVIRKGLYKDGLPYDGTFWTEYSRKEELYKEGKLIGSKMFYPNNKIQTTFSYEKGATYYDTTGQVISKLEYKDGYPFSGKEIAFDGYHLSRTSEYKDGNIVVFESFVNGVPSRVEHFGEDGYPAKTIFFYSNGKMKMIEESPNYNEESVTYFDKKEKEIGRFTRYPQKDGVEIVFNEDIIQSETHYSNGAVSKEKKYFVDGDLQYSIDYNGKAEFYDVTGELLGSASYKDGRIYDGLAIEYDYSNRLVKKATYKDGLLHGAYVEFVYDYVKNDNVPSTTASYKSGMKDGLETKLIGGNISSEINWKDDKKEGKVVFYNPNGEILSEAVYKNDEPFEGTFYTFDYNHQTEAVASYKNGKAEGFLRRYNYDQRLVHEARYEDGVIQQAVNYTDENVPYTIYYRDGLPYDGVLLDDYSISNYNAGFLAKKIVYANYDLKKISYDIVYEKDGTGKKSQYYDSGKIKSVSTEKDYDKEGLSQYFDDEGKLVASGTFKNNTPWEGSFIYFKNTDYSGDYIRLEIQDNTLKAGIYESDQETYQIQHKILKEISDAQLKEAIDIFMRDLQNRYYEYDYYY